MSVLDEPGSDPVQEEQQLASLQSEAPVESESQQEAEPQPEAVEDVKAEEPEQPKKEEDDVPKVPIHALHEARAELREQRQQMAQMREMVDTWRKQMAEQQQAERRQELDQKWNDDPLAYLRQKIDGVEQKFTETTEQQQQREAQERHLREFQSLVQTQVEEFSKQTPDYHQAVEHLLGQRAEELRVTGMPENQIRHLVDQEAASLAQAALQQGRNPAQVAYELARVRGYRLQAAAEADENTQKLDRVEKGQQASKTLSGTQGKPQGVSITDISKMSDDEFDRMWDEMGKEARGAA